MKMQFDTFKYRVKDGTQVTGIQAESKNFRASFYPYDPRNYEDVYEEGVIFHERWKENHWSEEEPIRFDSPQDGINHFMMMTIGEMGEMEKDKNHWEDWR